MAAGANIEPEENILRALDLLRRQVTVGAVSTFYRTEAIGRPDQPPYLNGVVQIDAPCSARALKFEVLRPIEAALGRVRSEDAYAARPIDLDVLSFGREVLRAPDIELPDPDLRRRAFLLYGMRELCPEFCLPGTGESVDALLAALDASAPTPDLAFTQRLRESLTS